MCKRANLETAVQGVTPRHKQHNYNTANYKTITVCGVFVAVVVLFWGAVLKHVVLFSQHCLEQHL